MRGNTHRKVSLYKYYYSAGYHYNSSVIQKPVNDLFAPPPAKRMPELKRSGLAASVVANKSLEQTTSSMCSSTPALSIQKNMVWPGEKKAWDILSGLDSRDVSTNAKALFKSHDSTYELTCLGQDICISLTKRKIFGNSTLGNLLVNEFAEYSSLSILRYLIHAIDLPLSGQLVRPSDLPGGNIFIRGTHVLPLDKIAAFFSHNFNDFLRIGKSLGGSKLDYGDMSLELFPFPRVPVVIIVRIGDEEFPPKSSLLFDSSCVSHLSTDIIWSTAMMVIDMMLKNTKAYNNLMERNAE